MSTLKVDSLVNGGKTIDFTYNAKVSNGTLKKEYYEQSTEPAYPCDGALWFNTSDDTFHTYANGGWYATTANQVVALWYGSRGVFAGGNDAIGSGFSNVIDYITIASTGNATDFGNLVAERGRSPFGISDGSRGVVGGGYNYSTDIDYFTVATSANAVDFGDLTTGRQNPASASDGVKGIIISGTNSSNQGITNVEKITIATTGNATSYSGTVPAAKEPQGWSNGDRAVFHLGIISAPSFAIVNTIEYLSIQTEGNSTDFGDMTVTNYSRYSTGSRVRALFAGGDGPSDVIDYVTMATAGNATDFGNLTVARIQPSAASNAVRATIAGGYNSSTRYNTIDYVTIDTTGNATDFGDLTVARKAMAGLSGT